MQFKTRIKLNDNMQAWNLENMELKIMKLLYSFTS